MKTFRVLTVFLVLGTPFYAGTARAVSEVAVEEVAHSMLPDAEALAAAGVDARALEQLSLEQLQYGVDVVRETATAEELPVLEAIQKEILRAREEQQEPRQQKWIGRVASSAGISVNKAVLTVYRPFVYGTAYLVGRYGRRNRMDTRSNDPIRNSLGRIVNRLRDLGEGVAAEIGERALRGELLSRAEIELLVGRFPVLEPRDWEFFGSLGGMGLGVGITTKILRAAGIANLGPVVIAGEVAYVSAIAPCFINDLSKHPNMNEYFLQYCDRLLDDTYTRRMTSRIRGYLRGVRDRNLGR